MTEYNSKKGNTERIQNLLRLIEVVERKFKSSNYKRAWWKWYWESSAKEREAIRNKTLYGKCTRYSKPYLHSTKGGGHMKDSRRHSKWII